MLLTTCVRHCSSGSDAGLELAFSDWLVSPEEIEICHRADGSLWHLGSGGFGCVRPSLTAMYTELSVSHGAGYACFQCL